MNNKIAITVPVYFYKESNTLYDHPTQIDRFEQDETLTRLIDSIAAHCPTDRKLDLFIIIGRTEEDISEKMMEDVILETIRKKNKITDNITVYILGEKALKALRQEAKDADIPVLVEDVRYGNIRNLQLMTQVVFDNPYQINLDDDEIIINKDFFVKYDEIVTYLEKSDNKIGMGGFYVDAQMNIDVLTHQEMELEPDKNIYNNKRYYQQLQFNIYNQNALIDVAPAVFGGLNVMKKEAARRVCYDSYTPRAEDIDFVMHGMVKDLYFSFDREFVILHRPPGKSTGSHFALSEVKQLRDINRFIYQKMKFNALCDKFALDSQDYYAKLQVYPGEILKLSLEDLITQARDFLNEDVLNDMQQTFPQHIAAFEQMFAIWETFTASLDKNKGALKESFTVMLR